MLPSPALTALVLLALAILAGLAIARSIVIAQPDEWLLCIRNPETRAGEPRCSTA